MEFFKILEIKTTEEEIQNQLEIENLERFSSLLINLEQINEDKSLIGGLWGEFTLIREKIKGGLRFALLECPNALCWTVTTGYPPKRESVIIHLTINRLQKQQEFIDEIEEFLGDHADCLKQIISN